MTGHLDVAGWRMIIVTGGAGFIGSAMVWELNRRGHKNVVVVDNLAETKKWKNLVPLKYEDYIHKNAFPDILLEAEPTKIEAIFHMGACSSTTQTDADYLYTNNFEYTKALTQFSLRHGIRFIYASSAATYGGGENGFTDDESLLEQLRPINMYGYSKQLFDLWAQRTGVTGSIAGLKFFNVYGPNEYHKGDMASVVFKAFHQINETGKLKLFQSYRPEYGDGEQKRDFVYVKDVTAAMYWLWKNPDVNGIFNIGSSNARSWNELAAAVFTAMNKDKNIEYIPMPENLIGSYQYFTEASMGKLRKAGYTDPFHTLEEGVSDYVQNYLSLGQAHLG